VEFIWSGYDPVCNEDPKLGLVGGLVFSFINKSSLPCVEADVIT